jgi:hypothetical protein
MEKHTHNFQINDGKEVRGWVANDSSIMLKCVSTTDPVELSSVDARELARWLLEAADAAE